MQEGTSKNTEGLSEKQRYRRLVHLVFSSYELSQGDQFLHPYIIAYLFSSGARFDNTDLEVFQRYKYEICEKVARYSTSASHAGFPKGSSEAPDSVIQNDVETHILGLFQDGLINAVTKHGPILRNEQLIKNILKRMVENDYAHLEGREKKSAGGTQKGEYGNAFFSYCTAIFKESSMLKVKIAPEFISLFSDLRHILTQPIGRTTYAKLVHVLRVHNTWIAERNETHQNDRVPESVIESLRSKTLLEEIAEVKSSVVRILRKYFTM